MRACGGNLGEAVFQERPGTRTDIFLHTFLEVER